MDKHSKRCWTTHVRDLAELGIGVAGSLLGCFCLEEGLLLERLDVLAGVGYGSLGRDEGSSSVGLWEDGGMAIASACTSGNALPSAIGRTSARSALATLSRLVAGV